MDAELIGRAQHGDEEAFASLAVAVGGRLHAVAHRILRDIDLVRGRGDRLVSHDARRPIRDDHAPRATAAPVAADA